MQLNTDYPIREGYTFETRYGQIEIIHTTDKYAWYTGTYHGVRQASHERIARMVEWWEDFRGGHNWDTEEMESETVTVIEHN